MEPFTVHRGIVAPLDRANIDTDAIVPKQFLKSVKRTGFGKWLFYDWRYLEDERENPDFILNREPFRRATILLARNNFGCGSSREHAVWAVQQFGFRAVIAPRRKQADGDTPGFADIFRNNALKNGLLTIELQANEVNRMFELCSRLEGLEATVDLQRQRVVIDRPAAEAEFGFEIEPGARDALLKGMDDIDLSLQRLAAIKDFERRHDTQLYRRGE